MLLLERQMATFGARLKELREQAGLTQKELSVASGVTQAAIRDLEQEINSNPRWDTARKLAAALGVPLEAFAQDTEDKPEPRGPGRPRKTKSTKPPRKHRQQPDQSEE